MCIRHIPLDYSRKFAGLFGTLGYPRTDDCTSEASDDILAKISKAYEDRAVLKAEAEAAFAQGREKLCLYEDALREFMAKL